MGILDDDDWGHVTEQSGEYARLQQLENHLLLIFPIGYIDHSPTRFSVPGKRSDVIVSDVVDLDDTNAEGTGQGKVYRNTWWRGAQLIMSLRPQIGRRVLGRVGKGVAKNGMNAPWVIVDMATDPALLERARAWGRANPNFVISTFQMPTVVSPPAQAPASTYGSQTGGYPPPPQEPNWYQPPQPQGYPAQAPQGYPSTYPQITYDGNGYGQQPQQPAPQQAPRFPVAGAGTALPDDPRMLDMMRNVRAQRSNEQQYPSDPPF